MEAIFLAFDFAKGLETMESSHLVGQRTFLHSHTQQLSNCSDNKVKKKRESKVEAENFCIKKNNFLHILKQLSHNLNLYTEVLTKFIFLDTLFDRHVLNNRYKDTKISLILIKFCISLIVSSFQCTEF